MRWILECKGDDHLFGCHGACRVLLVRQTWHGLLSITFGTVALWTCTDPGERQSYFDFDRRLAASEVHRDTPAIDIGTEAGRRHLISGWSQDETDGRGERFAYVTGGEAELRFHLFAPRPLEIRLSCRFHGGREEGPRAVQIELNGSDLGSLQIGKKLEPQVLRVPAGLTQSGANWFKVRTASQAKVPRWRRSRLGCYQIDLGGAETAEPLSDAEGNFVFLPTGTALAYALVLEPGSQWVAERVALRGEGTSLEVVLDTDEERFRSLETLDRPQRNLVLRTEVRDRTPARLILRAHGASEAEGSGVVVEGGRLEAVLRNASTAEDPPQVVASDEPAKRPNVFIYLVDTLRPDRLGCYGYERGTSPNIDRFAETASLFENAFGQSSWTKPSTASMFTGLRPTEHGATGWHDKLPGGIETMAEALKAAGYRTAGYVANPNVIPRFGFDQGFDDYHVELRRPSAAMNERVFAWLDEHGDEPFFYYLHTIDPHAPYSPPEPFRSRFAPTADQMPSWKPRWKWPAEAKPYLSDLYDADIAANDESFGRLLQHLKKLGVYDDTLVVLVSDHGEAFLEHGHYRHGRGLFSETLLVPLIIKFPGQREGQRIAQPVQHADIMPTVLDELGLAVPEGVVGQSLAAFGGSSGGPPLADRALHSHLNIYGSLQMSVVDGDWKLIQRERGGRINHQLYNWSEDRDEMRDLARERPVLAAVLKAKIAESLDGSRSTTPKEGVEIDAETEEALRALGYLQ